MPKSSNQKLKLLYLRDILLSKSDENHPLTLAQIIDELEACGIAAERKSLYDDLEALRLYGLDIVMKKGKTTGYYVGSRTFELAELKLLVDSVQASKFITHKKSLALIRKLEGFASLYDAQLLQRQVYVANRIKTMNESIYYNVDKIHCAIGQNCKISFKYFDYSLKKQRVYRRGGKKYTVSPLALAWQDENYYMLGYDAQAGIIKHYRVDKMSGIEQTSEKRDKVPRFSRLDMAVYAKKVFSMYGGEETDVKLRFENSLVGVVIDRFGRDIAITRDDDEHFTVNVSVMLSPQFYGWLFGLAGEAQIISPEYAAEQMRQRLICTAERYAAIKED